MNELLAKHATDTIAEDEAAELTSLCFQAEEWHAERLAALAQLSQLRGVSLPVLLGQLGITFPKHG